VVLAGSDGEANAKKNAPPGAGQFGPAAVAPDPGLHDWANHEAWCLQPLFPWSRPDLHLRTPSLPFEVADDSASVRGDSVKAPSPFGGALRKTSRCSERHTLPRGVSATAVDGRHGAAVRPSMACKEVPQSAMECETHSALWITGRAVSAGRVRIGGGSIRSKLLEQSRGPRFRPPQSPTPMEVKSGASFPLSIISPRSAGPARCRYAAGRPSPRSPAARMR
jgi:hypothetical protein